MNKSIWQLRDHTEFLFLHMCEKLDIEELFEVGSNIPRLSINFVRKRDSNRAYAFEPNPLIYSFFLPLLNSNGLVWLNSGVGSNVGLRDFFLPGQPWVKESTLKKIDRFIFPRYHKAIEFFHRVSNEGGSFVPQRFGKDSFKTSVMCVSLEPFLQNTNKAALWIDCESNNLEVLLSAKRTLFQNQVQLICIENDFSIHLKDSNNLITKLLRENGFNLFYTDASKNGIFLRQESHTFCVEELEEQVFILRHLHSIDNKKGKRRRTKLLRLISWFVPVDRFLLSWVA